MGHGAADHLLSQGDRTQTRWRLTVLYTDSNARSIFLSDHRRADMSTRRPNATNTLHPDGMRNEIKRRCSAMDNPKCIEQGNGGCYRCARSRLHLVRLGNLLLVGGHHDQQRKEHRAAQQDVAALLHGLQVQVGGVIPVLQHDIGLTTHFSIT